MGRLVYLMGASGSGKDTLIAHLVQEQPWPVFVPHRYITRPVNQTQLEQHVYMTLEDFEAAKSEGLFAFHWQANGHQYAIGQDMQTALAAGKMVVINGSRQHFQALSDSLKNECVPVYLMVSAEIQRQRLQARARETAEQIQARINRSHDLLETLPQACVILDANQSAASVYAQFVEQMQQLESVPS